MNGKLKNRLKFHFQAIVIFWPGPYRNDKLIYWIYYIYFNLIFQLPTILPTFCKGQSVWRRDWCCLRKGKNACLFTGQKIHAANMSENSVSLVPLPLFVLCRGVVLQIFDFAWMAESGKAGKTFLGRLDELARFVFASGVNLPFGCWAVVSIFKMRCKPSILSSNCVSNTLQYYLYQSH